MLACETTVVNICHRAEQAVCRLRCSLKFEHYDFASLPLPSTTKQKQHRCDLTMLLSTVPNLLRATQVLPQALSVAALMHTTSEVSQPVAKAAEAKPALFKVCFRCMLYACDMLETIVCTAAKLRSWKSRPWRCGVRLMMRQDSSSVDTTCSPMLLLHGSKRLWHFTCRMKHGLHLRSSYEPATPLLLVLLLCCSHTAESHPPAVHTPESHTMLMQAAYHVCCVMHSSCTFLPSMYLHCTCTAGVPSLQMEPG